MRYFCFWFLLVLGFLRVNAQIDTSFWFVAPDISSGLGDNPIALQVSSYNGPASVLIRQPANPGFTPITVTLSAWSTSSVNLTSFITSIENTPANSILNRGLYISSTSDVSVNYIVDASSNKEIISLKGRKAAGNDFYCPFQTTWKSAGGTSPKSFSSIDIIATRPNTKVAITPRAKIIGHAKDVTFTVTLQAGETFSCVDSTTQAPTQLAGSIISSDSTIAVTVTSHGLTNGGCNSTISEQITTSSYAGTQFAVVRGETAVNKIYALATVNNTSITVNDGVTTTSALISTGQTFSLDISQPLAHVLSTQPIYLLHITEYGCKLSGAQVPNIYCQGSYSTSFTRANADSFALNLYTRTGYEGMFTLVSGTSTMTIPATSFTALPGTSGNIMAARIFFNTSQIAVGSSNKLFNTGDIFGCGINYGSAATGGAYTYISEFSTNPYTIAGPSSTICSNTNYSINASIGGGNVTGSWSLVGYGSFLSGPNALNNLYKPNSLDTTVKPVKLILNSTGPCPSHSDTIKLYVKPAPVVSAAADQILCGNNATVTLNGSVTGPTSAGNWTSMGTGTFAPLSSSLTGQYVPSSADTAVGSVKLVLTSTGNGICNAETDTMMVIFTAPPSVNAGPTTITKCVNNASIALSGTVTGSSLTGKWTTSGSGLYNPNNIQLNSIYIPSSADLTAGNTVLYLSSTNNGNCFPVTDSIMVNFTPSPLVNAGLDFNVCKNNYITPLNGTITAGSIKGKWTGGSGTYAPNDSALTMNYIPTAADLSTGFVVLTLTSTNNGNCLAVSDQIRIDYRDKPIANFAFNTVCLNQATQFTDFSNSSLPASLSSWDWSFGDASPNSTAPNPFHTFATAGTFSTHLIVKNSFNCYDTITKSVKVYNLPNAQFSYSRSCSGSALQINLKDSSNIASPDTISSYFWDYGGLGTSTAINPSQVFPFPGNYNVTHIVTSTKGCKDTIVKNISITPRPKAGFYFINNGGFNIGSPVQFVDTSQNAVSWNWNFNDGNISTLQNPSNIYYSNGTYTVVQVVADQFGCKDTARSYLKILTIKNDITELIPNVVTPNGDGKNDIWRLDFIEVYYPKATIEIYNRWGQQIFLSTGYSNAWDGTYKGDALPVGTYYYIIDLKDPSKPDLYKGTILILK